MMLERVAPALREFKVSDARQSRGVHVRTGEMISAVLLCALLAVLLSFAMGRDLNWDYFNYHGYAAHDLFGNRLDQDFFPAGYQGYLSRLPFALFSWMDRAGWHSLVIASILAAAQSLNAVFLYLIVRRLTCRAARPRLVAASVTLLGCASGVFVQQLGSTFVDPITNVPLMAALWVLLKAEDRSHFALAGLLAGAATALKLTNAPFALALIFAPLVSVGSLKRGLVFGVWAGLGAAIGFAVLYGPWGWKLWQIHGSFVFPLFNQWFHAAEFPAQPIIYNRFIPLSLTDALLLPYRMAEHRSYVYAEGVVPDVRAAILVTLAIFVAGLSIWRASRADRNAGAFHQSQRDSTHLPARLAAFMVVATLAWLVTSANGRYAVPLLLLTAPCIYLSFLYLAGVRWANIGVLLVLALQTLVMYDAGNPRWYPQDWTSRWLSVVAPPALKATPHLFVSTATTSESYLAAHVHPDSAFVNPIGLLSIKTDGPGWQNFIELRDRHAGKIRVIFPLPPSHLPNNARQSRIDTMNGAVDRLGLSIQRFACEQFVVDERAPGLPFLWNWDSIKQSPEPRLVAACPADIIQPSQEKALARRNADEIFDAFERKCPKVFAPGDTPTEGSGTLWSRLYGKHDLFAMIDQKAGTIFYRLERQSTDVFIGQISTWRADLAKFRCRLPHDGRRDIGTLAGDEVR